MILWLTAVARFLARQRTTSARAALGLGALALTPEGCDRAVNNGLSGLGEAILIVLIILTVAGLIATVALGAFVVSIARRISGKKPWDAKPLLISGALVWLAWAIPKLEAMLFYVPGIVAITLFTVSATGLALRARAPKLRNSALVCVTLTGAVASCAAVYLAAPVTKIDLTSIRGVPVSVSSASFAGCVAYSSGEVVCDNLIDLGVDEAPSGPIVIADARGATEVSVTPKIACAIVKQKDLVCWGGKEIAPKSFRGSFKKIPTWTIPHSEGAVEIAVTPWEVIGRRDDGSLFGFPKPPPEGFDHARALASSTDHVGSRSAVCILADAGRARCATWSDPWDKTTGLELKVRELPELADIASIAASFEGPTCVSLKSGDLRCSKEGGAWTEPVLGIHDAVEVHALSGIGTEIAIRRKTGAVLVWTPSESSEREGPKWAIVHPVFDSDGPLLHAGSLACSFRSDHMAPVVRPPQDPNYEAPRWISETPTALPFPGGLLCTDYGGREPDTNVEALLNRR